MGLGIAKSRCATQPARKSALGPPRQKESTSAGQAGRSRASVGRFPIGVTHSSTSPTARCGRPWASLTVCRGKATSRPMSDLPSAGGPSPLSTSDSTAATVDETVVPTTEATPEGRTESKASAQPPSDAEKEPHTEEPRRSAAALLMPSVLTLLSIGIVLWLIFAWSGYSTKYSQSTEGWKLNSTKMIEITVVAEDRVNLACSSDITIGGVHCGYRNNRQQWGGEPKNDSQVLQPFNTVANELFLGAGLWTSPALPKQLPGTRFTVMCNYKVLGAAKSVSLRWAPKGSFDPLKSSVAVGALSDCVIPE